MATFLQLQVFVRDREERLVWVNFENVTHIEPSREGGSILYFVQGHRDTSLIVTQSPDLIVDTLEKLGKPPAREYLTPR